MSKVDALMPLNMPLEVRGDLKNDIVVALLSGEISLEELPIAIKKFATRAKSFVFNQFRDISIYAPLPGTDDLKFSDILQAPPEYTEEAE